jgi:hypothetical protein
VRGKQHRQAPLGGGLGQVGHELAPRQRIKRGGRLIEDQQRRLLGQRHRQGQLRPLPAGQLARLLLLVKAQVRDPFPGQVHIPARVQVRAQLEMIGDRHARVHRGVLCHEPHLRQLLRTRGRGTAGHLDPARRRREHPGDHAQQRGLARTVRPDQARHGPGRHPQRAIG